MCRLCVLGFTEPGRQVWFWAVADVIVGALLLLNVLLLVFVHVRRVRQSARARRATRFRTHFERLLAEQGPGKSAAADSVRQQLRHLNGLERPLAFSMVIERLREVSPEERKQTLEWLREVGAVDTLLRSVRRWAPWRRALAIRVLGLAGAEEAVPALIERLSDRSRYVREAAARALGRVGDPRGLPPLAQLFAQPGRVSAGIVYEALLAFGSRSKQVFGEGLRSPDEHVRVPSVYGLGTVDPERARLGLGALLVDNSAGVRAAAAEMLGRIGGTEVGEELARATRDEERGVRRAAVSALARFDDPHALQLALSALDDPDRDTAVRAGEAIVELSRLPVVGASARDAAGKGQAWPLERARILASLEAV
jgi:HEAT repeat protein